MEEQQSSVGHCETVILITSNLSRATRDRSLRDGVSILVTISLVVELKVAEGVCLIVSLGNGYLSTSTPSRYRTISSRAAFLVLPNLGDRDIASLHVVGVEFYYIVGSVASNLGGGRQLHPQ